jgi:SAM-dependent methyltransferase
MRIIRKFLQNRITLPSSTLKEKLQQIDQKIASTAPGGIPSLFSEIPLDAFGDLILDVPDKYPNIKAFLPSMPPDEIQDQWNSRHGKVLLVSSLAFIKTLTTGYTEITEKDLGSSRILDYGCGWGRLIRLLYKYTSYENIYGVDPWDKSIDLCKQYAVKGNLAVCDYVPRALPFEQTFDLIFAHSVFTHLSEKTAKIVLSTLRKYVHDSGLVVITIRPKDFWSFHHQGKFKTEMYKMHEEQGFAFHPHAARKPVDGDITYGDTSISLGYIEENYPQWELVRLIMDRKNPYQTVLFLRPR